MALKRILVWNDGSTTGRYAVETGKRLANVTGAILGQVVVAVPGSGPGGGLPPPPSGETPGVIRRDGVPGVEIARCAEQWEADLVVLGRGAPEADTTIDMVLRRSTLPVLLAPAICGPFQRAVFALDGTARGLRILESRAEFGAILGDVFSAVCVLPNSSQGAAHPVAAANRLALLQAEMDLRPELGGRDALTFRRGDAVAEVVTHLRDGAADLLVLGRRQGGSGTDPGSGHAGRDLLGVVPIAILTVPI